MVLPEPVTRLVIWLRFWSAMLLLLPQALWVRQTAPRFAAAAGAAEGMMYAVGGSERAASSAAKHLLGIGDSIVAGVGCAQQSQALTASTATALAIATGDSIRWQALGKSGADASRVLRLLQQHKPLVTPHYIVLSTGVNDVTSLKSCRRWRSDLHHLLDALQHNAPKACIAVAAVPPLQHFPALPQPLRTVLGWRAAQFSQVQTAVLSEYPLIGLVRLDFDAEQARGGFAADGYHPTVANYKQFGDMAAAALLSIRSGASASQID
jgi:lysophospholipase L1-like esterase